jgi:predicted TIM-barrel fold metal-dependent hydrolase
MESSARFLVSHTTPDETVHYHDYWPVYGEVRSVFETRAEEEAFVEDLKRGIRNHRKLFAADKYGDQIVTCIYTFLNGFVRKST